MDGLYQGRAKVLPYLAAAEFLKSGFCSSTISILSFYLFKRILDDQFVTCGR